MSEFADYVEKQQANRHIPGRDASVAPSGSGYGTASSVATEEYEHEELAFLDTLDLSDAPQRARLKDLLLGPGEEEELLLQQLSDTVQDRLVEGHGETLFDVGLEDSGETMNFNKEQWDVALDRIRKAASSVRAECRMLLTKNVGGPEEAVTKNEKETAVSGKMLVRQHPATVEDVIETRIAVVGNGAVSNLSYFLVCILILE